MFYFKLWQQQQVDAQSAKSLDHIQTQTQTEKISTPVLYLGARTSNNQVRVLDCLCQSLSEPTLETTLPLCKYEPPLCFVLNLKRRMANYINMSFILRISQTISYCHPGESQIRCQWNDVNITTHPMRKRSIPG